MVNDATRALMLVDHVGVDLWRAFRAFEEAMFSALVEAGYADVTLADSDVLAFVGPDGTRSVELAKNRRISKQAAQEQVKRLVARGYLDLAPDPMDRRAKRVTLTKKGEALMRDLVAIKRGLHDSVGTEFGEAGFAELRVNLERVRRALDNRRGGEMPGDRDEEDQ